MKIKLVFLILASLVFFYSCDLWDADLVEYLEYYSTTAAIDHYELDSNYPSVNGVTHISGDAEQKISFIMRNPKRFTLFPSILWHNDEFKSSPPVTPTDYTLVQVSSSVIELTLTNSFVSRIDKDIDLKDISATIGLISSDGRVFESYDYDLLVNTAPPEIQGAQLLLAGNVWVVAFELPTLEEKHRDVEYIIVNGIRKSLDVDDSTGYVEIDDALSPFTKTRPSGLESVDGGAFSVTDGKTIYYVTNDQITSSVQYSLALEDSNGLATGILVGESAQSPRIDYFVDTSILDDTGAGTELDPFKTVNSALSAIDSLHDENVKYTIHIRGTVTAAIEGTTGDSIVSVVSSEALTILLRGWSGFTGTIDGGGSKRPLFISGAGANVVLGPDLTLSNGKATNGGGVYVESSASFSMTGGAISDNTAEKEGGGVYVTGGGFLTIGETDNPTINDNTAENGGGVTISQGAKMTIMGGTIKKNEASNVGGGIFIYKNTGAGEQTKVEMQGGSIVANTAAYGGGINLRETCVFTMSGGSIQHNKATVEGGGLRAEVKNNTVGTINLSGTPIITNNGVGGSISGETLSSSTPSNIIFENDTVDTPVKITAPLVTQNGLSPSIGLNPSNTDMGAIALFGNGNVTASNVHFIKPDRTTVEFTLLSNNLTIKGITEFNVSGTASSDGDGRADAPFNSVQDAIDLIPDGDPTEYTITISDTVTIDDITISSVSIEKNIKVVLQGASAVLPGILDRNGTNDSIIHINHPNAEVTLGPHLKLTGANFISGSGGAVKVYGGTFNMTGGEISGNHANGSGGGVYVSNATFNLSGGVITGNNTNNDLGKGGGVCISNNSTLNLSGNPEIKGNTHNGYLDSSTGKYTGGTENNLAFSSAGNTSPVKIKSALNGNADTIGISVNDVSDNDVVVSDLKSDSDVFKFFDDEGINTYYKDGTDLKFSRVYAIGQIGPGGGIIYDISPGAHKEISSAVVYNGATEMNWETAKIAADSYIGGGLSDWYLPPIEELNTAYTNAKYYINSSEIVWSSTLSSYDTTRATRKFFDDGATGNVYIGVNHVVYAIRSFSP